MVNYGVSRAASLNRLVLRLEAYITIRNVVSRRLATAVYGNQFFSNLVLHPQSSSLFIHRIHQQLLFLLATATNSISRYFRCISCLGSFQLVQDLGALVRQGRPSDEKAQPGRAVGGLLLMFPLNMASTMLVVPEQQRILTSTPFSRCQES